MSLTREISEIVETSESSIAAVERGRAGPALDWGAKSLYLGLHGARNWLDVVRSASGSACGSEDELQRRRLAAIRAVACATYVSLGPGDGRHDVEIVERLKVQCQHLSYVPVDISRGLLQLAIHRLALHAVIPVGVQCDLETDQRFLRSVLERHVRRPLLVSLLGGTLGNLDLGEVPFFAGMKRLLGQGDRFLVEIPLAGPSWTPADEPRLHAASYGPALRRFFAGGLPAREAASFVANFDERIELELHEDGALGSKLIVCRDRRTGRMIRNRRYHWDLIRNWLTSQGFHIEYECSTIASKLDKLGMGLVLLQC